jgi:hypothetical protein
MSSLRRRLDKLEILHPTGDQSMEKGGRLPACIHDAEASNERRGREGKEPLFEITVEGEIYTRDGRPVTEYHQLGAEDFYWMEVEWGGPGLIHDEEAEAFYAPEGQLAVSRTRFDLRYLLNR